MCFLVFVKCIEAFDVVYVPWDKTMRGFLVSLGHHANFGEAVPTPEQSHSLGSNSGSASYLATCLQRGPRLPLSMFLFLFQCNYL